MTPRWPVFYTRQASASLDTRVRIGNRSSPFAPRRDSLRRRQSVACGVETTPCRPADMTSTMAWVPLADSRPDSLRATGLHGPAPCVRVA
ncbi:hypothetical protein PsYK624_030270 [Phanerochaete sordida]|uniref:Uncharacterized protein n=1 Tax=Phanerochaete sordida TaxID=48140 RepID=A0A9P3G3H2_9APHY|nr:hypothetical protein PsYK624_030270 [Phanerochaete sordida]